ncbi:MAG: MerR family transcriptional regulator [Anaerovoracaceae bacterium]|jgi:DNA-binding transcriptional MerR regulator
MRKVNEVSSLTGLSRRTLQYYDDEGLVPVMRSESNHRLYDEAALDKIWGIMICRELGLDLSTIGEMAAAPTARRREMLGTLRTMLEAQMHRLDEMILLLERVMQDGLPPRPPEEKRGGRTYVEWVAAWKNEVLEASSAPSSASGQRRP